jgi:hypothetical protein
MAPTRLDFSFDIENVQIDELAVFTLLRRVVTKRYEYGESGRLNAIYFGVPTSPRMLVMYDKALHLRIAKIEGFPAYRRQLMSNGRYLHRRQWARTRIEIRLFGLRSLVELSNLPNPFAKYTIREFRRLRANLAGHEYMLFLDSCRQRGMQGALSLIDDSSIRAEYAATVRQIDPALWWNTEQIWSEWQSALGSALGVCDFVDSRLVS